MPEDKYIVLSMQDKKSEDIAKVISNKTARQILQSLAEKSLSSNKLSKKLEIPISTVEYNIDQLVKVNLIRVKNTKWSVKGKEVKYYESAKKLILIAPEAASKSLLQTLLNGAILPITLIVIGVFGLIARSASETSLRSSELVNLGAKGAGVIAHIDADPQIVILKIIFLIIIIAGIILLALRRK